MEDEDQKRETPQPASPGENEPETADDTEKERGRFASRPNRIPPAGWADILSRTKQAVGKDHLSIISGGVAFFLLLGSVPALVALLSIYGYVSDPADVREQLGVLADIMPPDAYEVLVERLEDVTRPGGQAPLGAIAGIVLALWAGSRGTKGLIRALNIAYHEDDTRGLIHQQAVSFALTLALIFLGILAVLLVAGLPALINIFPFATVEEAVISWMRWPILLLMGITGLAIIYRYGPARKEPQWKWVSTGAIVATLLWLLVSAGFSFYVSNFGNFNETYGSLGAVVVLLMWLYLSAFLILAGAEINAEMEHQTREDTTKGRPRPMGKRGAYVADHLGKTR